MYGSSVKDTHFYVRQMKSSKEPIPMDQLITEFRKLQAPKGTKYALGRSVPHRSRCGFGFNGPALMVFLGVLMDGTIQIPPIDTDIKPVVVINATRYSWDGTTQSPLLVASSLTYYDHSIPANSSNYEDLAKIVTSQDIAVTPRERIEWGIPGDVSKNAKYSVRECCNGQPLSDFIQAAHDVRRMGWLLQDLHDDDSEIIQLRLPTRWHYDYLHAMLTPEPSEPISIDFDEFLYAVLCKFRASKLQGILAQAGTLHEVAYDNEFGWAADKVAGPLFLYSQARTRLGDGVVDFICLKRRWTIELMRDRSKLKDHLARFDDGGSYQKEWPEFEWRLVDFYRHSMPPRNETGELSEGKLTCSKISKITHTFTVIHENYRRVDVRFDPSKGTVVFTFSGKGISKPDIVLQG